MRFPWRAILGIGLSIALLYWALHDLDWSELAATLRSSDVTLWALAIIVSQLTFVVRARKWRTILDPVVPNVPFGPLWRSVAVGMAANNVVGRIGEPVRAFVLTREYPAVSLPTSLTSLVVDRVFDAVVVLTLLLVSLLDPNFGTGLDVGGKKLGVLVGILAASVVAAFAGLYLTVFAPAKLESFVGAVVRPFAPKLEARMRALVHTFADGLGVLRQPRRFAAVWLWTLLHWLINALAVWLSFRALGFDVPVTAGFFVQGLIAMAVALPSGPGYFGPFEVAAGFALAAYHIDSALGTTWALAYHILTFIPITALGLWYATRLGISWGEIRRSPTGRAPTA